jgi:hypothetical protein
MKEMIFEASFGKGAINKVLNNIVNILSKRGVRSYGPKTPFKMQTNSRDGKLFGVKFLTDNKKAFRINWKTTDTSGEIFSIDVWTKPNIQPQKTIYVKDLNAVQTVDLLTELVGGKKQEIKESFFDYLEAKVTKDYSDVIQKWVSKGGDISQPMSALLADIKTKMGVAVPYVAVNNFKKQALGVTSLRSAIKKSPEYKAEPTPEEVAFLKSIGLKPGQRQSGSSIFKQIEEFTRDVAKGKKNALIVSGDAGVGKTFNSRSILSEVLGSKGGKWVEKGGSMSAIGLYSYLYRNNGKVILFDDLTGPLDDKESLDILKKALDSNEPRTVSYNKMNIGKGDLEDLPEEFDFTGRIIFVTNKKFNEINSAVKSRAKTVNVDLSGEQTIDLVQSKLKTFMPNVPTNIKQDVLDYLLEMVQSGVFKGKLNFRVVEDAVATWLCTGVSMAERKQWIYFSLKSALE